jgi:hypothetical protein
MHLQAKEVVLGTTFRLASGIFAVAKTDFQEEGTLDGKAFPGVPSRGKVPPKEQAVEFSILG